MPLNHQFTYFFEESLNLKYISNVQHIAYKFRKIVMEDSSELVKKILIKES